MSKLALFGFASRRVSYAESAKYQINAKRRKSIIYKSTSILEREALLDFIIISI
jgi:hypothetical protein